MTHSRTNLLPQTGFEPVTVAIPEWTVSIGPIDYL